MFSQALRDRLRRSPTGGMRHAGSQPEARGKDLHRRQHLHHGRGHRPGQDPAGHRGPARRAHLPPGVVAAESPTTGRPGPDRRRLLTGAVVPRVRTPGRRPPSIGDGPDGPSPCVLWPAYFAVFSTRPLSLSEMYIAPSGPMATPCGRLNWTSVAGPPAPSFPFRAVPATRAIVPSLTTYLRTQ